MGVLEPSDKKATTLGTSHDKNVLIKNIERVRREKNTKCVYVQIPKGFLE